MPELTTISLGWGVQSWTLAAMAALGELPPVDYAIHADTTWERAGTYTFAAQWTPWLEERGVKVVTVRDAEQCATVTTLRTDIPAFTAGQDGHFIIDGQLRRQCTGRWKIEPQRLFIVAELEQRGLKKTPGVVEKWLGISQDEWTRAKDADVKYITHRYPLLEKQMTRTDCMAWLDAHDLPIPPKSACVFCPFHNKNAWQEMKRSGGGRLDYCPPDRCPDPRCASALPALCPPGAQTACRCRADTGGPWHGAGWPIRPRRG